jgi:hypothetical protein
VLRRPRANGFNSTTQLSRFYSDGVVATETIVWADEVEDAAMRWTQENLVRARGIVMVAVGALILLVYLISRLHGR